MRPVGHDTDLSVPIPSEYIHDDVLPTDASGDADEMGNNFSECKETLQFKLFTQSELRDLIRNFGLTKNKAELLGSRLKGKNM